MLFLCKISWSSGGNALVHGQIALRRFIEFFTANIRNHKAPAAYIRAVSDFFEWCEEARLRERGALQPVHVAAYVEQLGKTDSAPSVKQQLAAVSPRCRRTIPRGVSRQLHPGDRDRR